MSLQKEETAEALFNDGMQAAAAGAYVDAYALLDRANGIAVAAQLSPEGVLRLDYVLQSAAIRRGLGIVSLYQAAHQRSTGWLDAAGEDFENALDQTTPLYSGKLILPTVQPTPTKESRRAINAEHGTTLAVLGRMVTLSEVLQGQNSHGDSEEAVWRRTIDQAWFGYAGDALRIGSNGLARVQNALYGARQERINGQPLHAAVWVGRALAAIAWTALKDEHQLGASVRQLSSSIPELLSAEAARAATLARP